MISEDKKIKYASALILAIMLIGWGIWNLIRESRIPGSKTVTVEVTDYAETKTTYTGKTDAETLRDVMEELRVQKGFTYDGAEEDTGLKVTMINGLEGQWELSVNGEVTESGPDRLPVRSGDTFSFQYRE